jgi:hypothetical protein
MLFTGKDVNQSILILLKRRAEQESLHIENKNVLSHPIEYATWIRFEFFTGRDSNQSI